MRYATEVRHGFIVGSIKAYQGGVLSHEVLGNKGELKHHIVCFQSGIRLDIFAEPDLPIEVGTAIVLSQVNVGSETFISIQTN